ncbi:MAG: sugar-binding domain-containing protein [Clostridiales bacterium]|nr:sugar-binding domain-containing protein [Clostridiales bacterium]
MEDHTELLVRAASLYYNENLNQSEIADILGTSRPTVSRLLEEAKKVGVVEIIVHDPIKKDAVLSRLIREKFNLRDAIIINGRYDYDKSIQRCCEAAVQLFNTVIKNNSTVGITWGTVPSILSNMLENEQYHNIHVVQMVGCLGTGNPNVDGLELAIRMAKKLNGTYSNIYSPIFVKSREVHDYMVAEPQIAATLKKAYHTDVFLTGIGSMDSNTLIQRAGYWSDSDRTTLVKNGAVGHLLARAFDINGNPVNSDGWYVVGSPLEATKNAEWSIGVAADEFKAEAALGAIRGGYINVLIADELLADKLLELAAE